VEVVPADGTPGPCAGSDLPAITGRKPIRELAGLVRVGEAEGGGRTASTAGSGASSWIGRVERKTRSVPGKHAAARALMISNLVEAERARVHYYAS
jgi:hypothetical protein